MEERGSRIDGLGLVPASPAPVGGRLSQYLDFWTSNIVDTWVLETVRKGYSLEFLKPFPPLSHRILWTDVRERKVLSEEIKEMLDKKAIEQADPTTPGFYSTFFLVPKKDGGFRPILNLRPLNQFIKYTKFRMETSASILQLVSSGDWLASLDLKDAYFHVPVLPAHRPYLRFAFQDTVYQYRVLPFGLSTAPRVFTCILNPIVGLIHKQGVRFHPYLDDCLIIARSKQDTLRAIQIAIEYLTRAGFVINHKKSNLIPTQDIQFVGMRLRTDLGSAHLPLDRAETLQQCVHLFQVPRYLPARLWLRLLGLMAAALVVVPQARLHMRPIQMYFLSRWRAQSMSLDYKLMVPLSLLPSFQFWKSIPLLTQGIPFQAPDPQIVVTTDACNRSWGGHVRQYKVQGRWSPKQAKLHINCQELLAVHFTLKTFLQLVKNKVVKVRTDSISVKQYINKLGGTGSQDLCALAVSLLQWCNGHGITLIAEHVPGVLNTLADSLSRNILSQTEWSLKLTVVQSLFQLWGAPLIDLFATQGNKKCPVFCSWIYHEQAHHVDSLTMSWKSLHAYAFPPLAILSQVVQKARTEVQSLILIAPNWPRRPWFPLILESLIEDPIQLPLIPDLMSQDKGSLWHPNPALWCLVAWRISSVRSLREAYQRKLLERSLLPEQSRPTRHMNRAGHIFLDGVGRENPLSIPLLQM